MDPTSVDELYERTYLDVHTRWLKSQPGVKEMLR
jgi:hypothetical protein